MRKKTLQRILDNIEARTKALLGGGKNFGGEKSVWIPLKMRPTQFNSSKNFPAGLEKYKKETTDAATGVRPVDEVPAVIPGEDVHLPDGLDTTQAAPSV